MMKPKIWGAYTVLITPFDKEGQLDEEGLRKNIRFQLSYHIQGLVVLGTTGEAPTLSQKEKAKIISIAREETLGKCLLMVGTGSYATHATIENTLAAQDASADAALVVTPYYNKPTQEGLYQHFSTLAKAVKLPLVIYNIPGRTGQNLQIETLKRLAAIENIVGVKEASGNISQMMDVIESIRLIRPDFSIMSGDDALTYPLMALGGHGIYSVLSNLFPQKIKKLCDLMVEEDYPAARALHYELLPYMKSMFIETNPIPIKTAMNLAGHAAGPCRLPLCAMNDENLEKLKKCLKVL
ncbi:4-hydroxy-tetrahydrodipicolinate synthase [Neochlamydia sp. AcF65]|uniref:4-hydroxy-tetrahydrodipicolinate synthase n=1 Tax=Neochlamydia sp. AcF65 TaxID=2795735 RepID=UPI001BD86E56|nr:4-hydroxy-tetrahydrodipicolinate synthase [Neochlamydia sp. AcF65]MBS4165638.1 4-hydroxy-tetrahydrodipicolinate synthase [Neochlamydia sp. AcF65]